MKILLPENPTRFAKDNLTLNIHSLHHMHQSGNFSFDAPYQRGLVWTSEQKEFLITSLSEWVPINALYINEYNEKDPYEVVDGKQRMTTIFDYLNDGFTWKGYLFSELPDRYKAIIKSFSVSCYKTNFETVEECEMLYDRINFTGTPHIR